MDLSKISSWNPAQPPVPGRDYQVVTLHPLEQQEAIAYLPRASAGFVYTTESGESGSILGGGEQPIVGMACESALRRR